MGFPAAFMEECTREVDTGIFPEEEGSGGTTLGGSDDRG